MQFLVRAAFPLLLSLAFALAVFAVARNAPGEWLPLLAAKFADYWPPIVMIAPVALIVAGVGERRRGGTRSLVTIARAFVKNRRFHLVVPIASATVTGPAYNVFKQRVLPHSGYGGDALLVQIDRTLLGGRDAWAITHRLFPEAWATHMLDLLYHPLFFPMTLGVALCTYLPAQSPARFRYLVGLTLLLAGPGAIGSWLVPAVGPCFDVALHGTADFQPLAATLLRQGAELGSSFAALDYQARLLGLMTSGGIADGGGISALPSIHNALSTLFICFALSLHRRLAWVLLPYAALILIGSVHLGWHYLVDGLVGIVAAIVTWWATVPIARLLGVGRAGAPQIAPVPPFAPNALPVVKLSAGSASAT